MNIQPASKGSRTSDQFIQLVLEKKTEAMELINAYLIKNNKGGGEKSHPHERERKRERERERVREF